MRLLLVLFLLFTTPAIAQMEPAVGVPGDGDAAVSVGKVGSVNAAGWGLFDATFTAFTVPLQAAVNHGSAALSGWIAGWIVQAATVVLLCLVLAALADVRVEGWILAYGLRTAGVTLVAASASGYQQWVAGPLLSLPTELTPLVMIGGASTGGQPFDKVAVVLWTTAMTMCEQFLSSWSIAGAIAAFAAVITAIVGIVCDALAFGFYLLTHVILYLLIEIGPIAVVMLLARVTRNFFSGWLNAVASQLVALLLIAAILGTAMQVILAKAAELLATPAGDANTLSAVGSLIPFAGLLLILALVAWRVSTIAVGIVGGIAMGWMPMMGRAARSAMSSATSLVGSVASQASIGGGAGGGGAPAAGFAGRSMSGGIRP